MPKIGLASSVSFSDDEDAVFEIPVLSRAEVPSLFYSTDEIAMMKEEALMEMAGVAYSVSAEGKDLFQVEGNFDRDVGRQFRRKSLEKVSKSDLSPIRPARGKTETGTSKQRETPTAREPRERPQRERAAPQRSRSSAGPSRTDGRPAGPGGGRGPPRRAKSSLAAQPGQGEAVSLQQMQARLIVSSGRRVPSVGENS